MDPKVKKPKNDPFNQCILIRGEKRGIKGHIEYAYPTGKFRFHADEGWETDIEGEDFSFSMTYLEEQG